MLTSTCTLLIKGRNFNLLVDRLRYRGIELLKIQKIDENQTIIKVKYKNLQKVFAICQNMWYNELIGVGGFIAILQKIKGCSLHIVLFIISLILCFVLSNYCFQIQVNGVKGAKLYTVYNVLQDNGINLKGINRDRNWNEISQKIYNQFDDCDFVLIKKWGNRLIIDIISSNRPNLPPQKNNVITAKCDGKILHLGLYSGSLKVKVGDYCKQGQVLADGYYVDLSGERHFVGALAEYTLECQKSLNYTINTAQDPEYLKTLAVFDLGLECQDITNVEIKKVNQVLDKTTYQVQITYIYKEG